MLSGDDGTPSRHVALLGGGGGSLAFADWSYCLERVKKDKQIVAAQKVKFVHIASTRGLDSIANKEFQDSFNDIIDSLPKPVLVTCNSGCCLFSHL